MGVPTAIEIGRDGWRIRIETTAEMTGTATHFSVSGSLLAFENGELVHQRGWHEEIARDHM